MALLCSIYRSEKKPGLYIYLKKDAPTCELPELVRQLCGTMTQVMGLQLTPVTVLANADAAEVIKSIEQQGFYLQMPPGEGEPALDPRAPR